MKKSLGVLCLFGIMFTAVAIEPSQKQQNASNQEIIENDEYSNLPELGEPCRYVSGAYFGLGGTISNIKHKVTAKKKNSKQDIGESKSNAQFDLSLIAGFGSAFYKQYYAGIEFDFFKRFKGSSSRKEDMEVRFPSNIGLNMDVRFGRQLPHYGSLVYVTVGFARVIGEVTFYSNNKSAKYSFGSFYPTLGLGIEKKINNDWNIRGDVRFAITSKDDNKDAKIDKTEWKYEGKPNRVAFRISVTRNI